MRSTLCRPRWSFLFHGTMHIFFPGIIELWIYWTIMLESSEVSKDRSFHSNLQILTYAKKTSNILGTNLLPMLLFMEWYTPTKIPCERKTMGNKTGYKNVRQFATFTLISHNTPCLPPKNFLWGFTILPRELENNTYAIYIYIYIFFGGGGASKQKWIGKKRSRKKDRNTFAKKFVQIWAYARAQKRNVNKSYLQLILAGKFANGRTLLACHKDEVVCHAKGTLPHFGRIFSCWKSRFYTFLSDRRDNGLTSQQAIKILLAVNKG